MTTPLHSRSSLVLSAGLFLAVLIMVACNEANNGTKQAPAATQQSVQTTQSVFVVFDGPWAFAPDPKDANSVLALAPKTKSHRDLFVQTWEKTLAPGVYDLSLPVRSGPAAAVVDPNILQAKIEPQSVQHILDQKLERYAIRLPKPDAYVAALHYRSRAGSAYPPDASTEKDYVTSVSLRYSVTTLNGFSLAGSPDSGAFNPLLLQVETPTINFSMDPAHEPDPADKCHTHERESFSTLTKFLHITLFVDFPNDPGTCHDKDPQNPRAVKAEIATRLLSASVFGSVGSLRSHLLAALYFFGVHVHDCAAPIIVAGG